ncbi:MAG: segregation/condensation protein A [Legionellales bacterium]|nr:segregation/condensation protein A [Legionellales bacterium]
MQVMVQGEPIVELPQDLYIPPNALEVFLETFAGPLDLLLYLIKKQNLDILNIPIAQITRQYIEYIELMQQMQLELAAEYLVMAAMLAEIKSRMLLPKPVNADEQDEEDPRMQLIKQLQEYEQFKIAAEQLDQLPRWERDVLPIGLATPEITVEQPLPQVQLVELLRAFHQVLVRTEKHAHHQIYREPLSVRERMTCILEQVGGESFTDFHRLFAIEEGRAGVVVTFIAILELIKQALIEVVQNEAFAPIYIKANCAIRDEERECDAS